MPNHIGGMESKWREILLQILYSFVEQARNSGQHDGGQVSVEYTNSSALIHEIVWNSNEPFWGNRA